ncbi:MAG: substrate-binding domain-containing protein [Treponema sp.]|nr:substrate-binding domain-containing protein [Treponema sp.]
MKKLMIVNVLLFLFVSCGKQKSASPVAANSGSRSDEKKIVIGFSIDTLALERWQRDLDVFMNTAKEQGADVIVQNAGNSVDEQNRQLLYLADRKVDVVVVVPKKRDSLTETIQKLRTKGIPVISYDRLITDANISMYITVDTEKVGELMAKQLLSETDGRNWYCILGPDEDYNMTLIKQGVGKVINNTPVRITGTFYTAGWNYDLSYQEAVNLVTTGRIPDAIICGNDSVAGSVIQAFSVYYPERHIPVCGQDADIAACQNIVRGLQDFTVYKPITKLAEKAAECAVLLARGNSVEDVVQGQDRINNGYGNIPVIWLEPQIVTKANIDDVIIKSGFHTYGEVYRK